MRRPKNPILNKIDFPGPRGKEKPLKHIYGDDITTADIRGPAFTHAQWDALLDEQVEKIKELSRLKGGEYAGDVDRLENFRRNGADCGLPMESVWRVYAGKHWDAISTYIRDLNTGKDRVRLEPIAGRVDDLIVYLLLFKAMLKERGDA